MQEFMQYKAYPLNALYIFLPYTAKIPPNRNLRYIEESEFATF